MYKGIAVFLETDKTDNRLTWFRLVLAVEMENSLENFSRIQLISEKFSREFQELSRECALQTVSLLSVLTVSKMTATALSIGVLSV